MAETTTRCYVCRLVVPVGKTELVKTTTTLSGRARRCFPCGDIARAALASDRGPRTPDPGAGA